MRRCPVKCVEPEGLRRGMMMDHPVTVRSGVIVSDASKNTYAVLPVHNCAARIGESPSQPARYAVSTKRNSTAEPALTMRDNFVDFRFFFVTV